MTIKHVARTLLALAALAVLSACSTVGGGSGSTPVVGKQAMYIKYPGVPGSAPATLSAKDWDAIAYYEAECRRQLDAQQPSVAGEVLHDTVIWGVSGALGTAGGAKWAFKDTVSGDAYAKYGGGAGLASGATMGLTGASRANRYDNGQCLVYMTQAAHHDGVLVDVYAIVSAHSVNNPGIKRPDGPPSDFSSAGGSQQLRSTSTVIPASVP